MFVDASAVMAILKKEPGHHRLAEILERDANSITSAIAVVETVMSLGRQKGVPATEALDDVEAVLLRSGVSIEPVVARTGELALAAHSAYGKGSGHPARLNMGDCFAYAMAKQYGLALLYKGDDFAKTDLA